MSLRLSLGFPLCFSLKFPIASPPTMNIQQVSYPSHPENTMTHAHIYMVTSQVPRLPLPTTTSIRPHNQWDDSLPSTQDAFSPTTWTLTLSHLPGYSSSLPAHMPSNTGKAQAAMIHNGKVHPIGFYVTKRPKDPLYHTFPPGHNSLEDTISS